MRGRREKRFLTCPALRLNKKWPRWKAEPDGRRRPEAAEHSALELPPGGGREVLPGLSEDLCPKDSHKPKRRLALFPEIGYIIRDAFEVLLPKKVLKQLDRLPEAVQNTFMALVEDLKAKGPLQPMWKNYSKLGPNKYHCHLGYSWVACWWSEKGTVSIEVTYVGSRENAPY